MKKQRNKKIIKDSIGFVFFLLGITLLFSARWLLNKFGLVPIDQYLFHLLVPMENANTDVFVVYAKYIIPFVSISLILFHLLLVRINNIQPQMNFKIFKRNFSINIFPFSFIRKHYFKLSLIFLVISLIYVVKTLGVDKFIYDISNPSTLYEEKYVDPNSVKITFPDKKKNLIFIHLESMETSYTSKENGGALNYDLMTPLVELANNNVNFSNTNLIGGAQQVSGTSWTIAGMVAQSAGIPLKITIDGNEFSDSQRFLKNAVSLGDILNKEGYNQQIMVGSYLGFGGRDKYYQQHGDYKKYDLYTAIDNKKLPVGYYVWWGYEDSKLFSYAKEELTKLSNKDEPFNFTMLTANTHFFDGYLEDSCEKKYDRQYSNVIACSSKQVAEFIEWIKKQPFYKDTTIVLTGDHLTMDNNYLKSSGADENYNRTIFNTFINSSVSPGKEKNRLFTSMDYYPTVLASLGANIEGDRLALGTNLFSDKKTLAEELGLKKLDSELARTSKYYNKNFIYTD